MGRRREAIGLGVAFCRVPGDYRWRMAAATQASPDRRQRETVVRAAVRYFFFFFFFLGVGSVQSLAL